MIPKGGSQILNQGKASNFSSYEKSNPGIEPLQMCGAGKGESSDPSRRMVQTQFQPGPMNTTYFCEDSSKVEPEHGHWLDLSENTRGKWVRVGRNLIKMKQQVKEMRRGG